MTTNSQPPKNDGLLNFLSSILKKTTEENKEFNVLVASVTYVAEQVKDLTKTVELMITAVHNQNKAISDLYTVQEYLLNRVKQDQEMVLPETPKNKNQKPN